MLISKINKFLVVKILVIWVGLWCLAPIVRVSADRMNSDSYIIQFGNFNMSSGQQSDATEQYFYLTHTAGQTAAGPFGEYGVSGNFLGSGFQYIYQINEFSFVISDVDLDFGELAIDTHRTTSNQLTITTRGAGGYSVYAYELHPLRHSNGTDYIIDTQCNSNNCDEDTAGDWTDQTKPGFGYNMSGDDVPAGFSDSDKYKRFADNSDGEARREVMHSDNIAEDKTSTVTYKVGINADQAAGDYQTGIVFTAVPGY